MYKRFSLLSTCLLAVMLLVVTVVPAQAGSLSTVLNQTDDAFTFAEIRETDIRMFGPFATRTVLFGLPSNWQVSEGATLALDLRAGVRSLSAIANTAETGNFIGSLEVILNGNTIAVLPIGKTDLANEVLPIPLSALLSSRVDGRMELVFVLSSGETCLLDQQLELVILSSSNFTIPHTIIPPSTSWLNFPRPLYQDSIFPDTALIVVPDQPSAAELQSAMTVATGLQARTGNGLQLDLVTSGELSNEQLSVNNLVMVGRADSLSLLSQLTLPMGVTDGKFTESGEAGVLEMAASPWSPERVVIVVSGNTDEAVVKAAQSLTTGIVRPNRTPDLALVEQVQNVPLRSSSPVEQSLAEMGYDDSVFEGRGETSELFQFFIPVGMTVTTEAFFDLSLNHTTLLNFNQSALFVLLNDQPIGSVRLTETTANQPNNHVRIAIPPSAVKGGVNNLEVVALLQPVDECGDPNQDSLFLTLWADESSLFLPVVPIPADLNYLPDLAAYPSPFIESSSLDTTALVVQKDNPDTWRHAMDIAENLGAIIDGPIMKPALFFADAIPTEVRANYHFLIIGAASQLPIIAELNDALPAPFAENSDFATETNLQVTYRITPETPVGYLELLESPWNKNNVIVAVLGNKTQGVDWSVRALVNDDLRERLAGNFVVVNDIQTFSTDTRLSDVLEFAPVTTPEVPDTVTDSQPTPAVVAKPGWIFIALIATGALIVLVVLAILFTGWARNRKS